MQEYDVAMKLLLRGSAKFTMRELAECRLQPAGGLEKLLMQRQCLTCK